MAFKWNNKARLHMIEKSEFYYGNEQVYQYGYYDGYLKAISDCKSNEIFDKLYECKVMFSKGKRLTTTDMAIMVDEIKYLLTRATTI